jgi:hypothetical protein
MTKYYLIKDSGIRQILVAEGYHSEVTDVMAGVVERGGGYGLFRITTFLSPLVIVGYKEFSDIMARMGGITTS